MKIGILTYHRAHNYGAMLQAYALLTFLQERGYTAEFIDYWPKKHQLQYKLFKPIHGKGFVNKLINFIADILTMTRRYHRMSKFNKFAKNYLNIKSVIQYKDKSDFKQENKYDLIIVGSDQIWRNYEYEGKYIGFDPIYFCQYFPNTSRCISYAASMGIIALNNNDNNLLKQYLSTFDTILVRENSLKELINSLEFEADVVLDPTLLISKEQWNRILPATRFKKQPYVLYYELIRSQEALDFARSKAKALKCELLIMDSIIHTIPRKEHVSYASPIEFLHAIRDAEYIVATSFHGTAFSIIFEKQFITIGLNKNADRVLTLLNHLGICDHYQNKAKEINDIEYSKVQPLYNAIRLKSEKLLLNAITKS